MGHAKAVLLLVAVVIAINGSAGSLFDSFAKTDFFNGESQVLDLGSEQELASLPLGVVYVTQDAAEKIPEEMKYLAQVLSNHATPVTVYRATPSIVKDATAGQILVFREGRKIVYYGVRETGSILKFIATLGDASVKTITGKLDKVAFDNSPGMKLVGYFTQGTPELQNYEQAASLFSAQVSFYVVTDPLVAKHLKLNATGQIHLVREFDKHPVLCQANPATLADIQQLIVFNRNTLVKVTPLNVLDPALTSTSAVVLITDRSPMSYHLIKLITRNQRQSATSATAKTSTATTPPAVTSPIAPRVLWLDTNEFPTFNLATLVAEGHAITKLPALGFWDSATKTSKWMDLLPLNASPADKTAEEANLLLVKAFLATHATASAAAAGPSASAEQTKTEL